MSALHIHTYKREQSMILPPPLPHHLLPLLQLAKEVKRVVFQGDSGMTLLESNTTYQQLSF